jgi:hypothetical protein
MKQNVNYIIHHKNVSEKMIELDFNATHISLYNALFLLWNNCGFDENLSINRNDVMNLSKIGSVNTYLKCLKDLDNHKIISYKPSHNPLKGSIINLFRFDTSSDIVINKYNTSTDTSSDKSSDTLYKLLNNKTIKLIKENIDLINSKKFEDFINSGKEDNIDVVFDFKKSLIDYGFEKKLVNDWLKVRKTKKATNSETAFNNFIKQIEENGNDKNKILEQLVTKSWSGFNSDWKLEIEQNNAKENYDEGMAKRAKEKFEKGTMTKERILEVYSYDIDTDKFTINLKPW